MIKIALKHFIYEKCIDTVFKGIERNFINEPRSLKPGDKLTSLTIICKFRVSNRYYDVTIEKYFRGHIISFSYRSRERYSGNLNSFRPDPDALYSTGSFKGHKCYVEHKEVNGEACYHLASESYKVEYD